MTEPMPLEAGGEGWIIVASRTDEDVIDFLLKRLAGKCRSVPVLWAERGPIRFYSNSDELRRDLSTRRGDEAPVFVGGTLETVT